MALNLAEQIQEDHLTCRICFGNFITPKALPCLHTFCETCIRDFVVSRSYELEGKFPCPICRVESIIPANGIAGFPDNHLLASLLDTLNAKRQETKPIAAPRRPPPISRDRSFSANDLSALNNIADGSENLNLTTSKNNLSVSTGDLSERCAEPSCDESNTCTDPNCDDNRPIQYPSLPTQISQEFESIDNTKLCFGKYGASVSDFLKPKGLAVSPSGEIVISDMGGNRIMIFSAEGNLIRRFACDCKVHDVAITSEGNILIVVHGAKSVIMKEYSFSGKLIGSYGSNFHHDNPSGLSIAPDNSVVITSIENNQVYIFNKDKKLQHRFGKKGIGNDGFLCPYHVTTNTKGDIIVSDYGNNAVKIYDKLGKFKLKFGGEGSKDGQLIKPLGIATDSNNNIYVADSGNNRVQVFNTRGKFVVTSSNETDKIESGAKPMNVALSPTNELVVLLTGERFAQVRVYAALPLPAPTDDPESCRIA